MERPFGFALAGTGMIADFHARAVACVEGAKLVAVTSRQYARAQPFAAKHGCDACCDLDAMVARPDVDALIVATPSGLHLEAVLCAAHHGKHALCEKPLEISVARCQALVDAHRAAGTQLGCTFQLRYQPVLVPIRQAIQEGRFGTITSAGIYVPWWRDQAYYSESPWHGKLALDGGGALMNQAIHMVDLLCDLMPPVESVCGVISSLGHPGIEAEDTASAVVQFQGGAIGMIYGTTASWPGQSKRLEITGTKGSVIMVDDALSVYAFQDERPEDAQVRAQFSATKGALGAGNPASAMTPALHAACFRDIMQACRGTGSFGIDGVSAMRSVRVIEAIYASARSGQRIVL